MSSYFAGQMAGGLIAAVALTVFLWFTSRGWPPSYGKAIYLNLVALAIGVMLRAIGNAEDGPPHVLESFAQLLIPQALVLVAFLMLARRHLVKSLPYPELADSQFILKLNTSSHPTARLERGL
jgi:hypothetical protein